jgi:PTH1 family peptidyl-tRNA hydrolase
MIKLIVGLGNIGKKYLMTKHNIGFMVLDHYASYAGFTFKVDNRFKGEVAKYKDVYFLKPHTFMNLSGDSIVTLLNYYKIDPDEVLVIYDDLDLPFGQIRLRKMGGSGGHNGVKSIISRLHTEEFNRFRIGIDKNPMMDTADYVLSNLSKKEQSIIKTSFITYEKIIDDVINHKDINYLMNTYNKAD